MCVCVHARVFVCVTPPKMCIKDHGIWMEFILPSMPKQFYPCLDAFQLHINIIFQSPSGGKIGYIN